MVFLVFLQELLQEVKQLKSKVEELEGEKSQYERKLRATTVHNPRFTHVLYVLCVLLPAAADGADLH